MKPSGVIDLEYMTVEFDSQKEIKLEKFAGFSNQKVTYTLTADTLDDARDWVKYLKKEVSRYTSLLVGNGANEI
jgi:hypothetical protein